MNTEALFKEIFQTHKDNIYRICCCYVREREDRLDVYQEVLVRVWKNLPAFEGKSKISTWIYRIAVNTCYRYLEICKRKQRMFKNDLSIDHENIPDPSAHGDVDAEDDQVDRLYDYINQLPTIDRTLISLSLEDVSTKEIAEILGISEVNTRVKLHRARKTLKTMLEKNDHGSR